MNGRAIPGAYLFRLYVCDKEMSWPHHIGETHQPEWVVYVRDSEKFRLTNVILERIIFVSRGITVLQNIVNAPWYIRNNDLHRDLEMDVVSSETQRFAQKHEERHHHHENDEAIQLLDNMGIVRRLQRKKRF